MTTLLCNCPPDRSETWSRGQLHNQSCPFARCPTCGGTKEEPQRVVREMTHSANVTRATLTMPCWSTFHDTED